MDKPVITMSTLGANGRFANQLFQYAFLRIYGKLHEVTLETPPWIGRELFGHNDPPISRQLPMVRVESASPYLADALNQGSPTPFKDVDFWGYFQYHTRCYAPHRDFFRALFIPLPEVAAKTDKAIAKLRRRGKTIVGIHLRRNDYGYQPYFIAPTAWYREWLAKAWGSLNKPVLYIATDEPDKVLNDFSEYHPMTARELGIQVPGADFYGDFNLLSHCDIVAISNSSYSFAACMLNDDCKLFLRPDLNSSGLITFDPWCSEVLLYDDGILNEARGELENGDFPAFKTACDRIMETHPYNVIGFASDFMERALKLNHPVDDVSCLLGQAFQETGKLEIARDIYEKTVRINPNHREASIRLEYVAGEITTLRTKDSDRTDDNNQEFIVPSARKLKVLLLSLPGLNTGDLPLFPLGIGYLLSSLRQDRLVQALHYQRSEHVQSQLPDVICEYLPDIVGLTCSTFNRGLVRETCQWLRATHPEIRIILGGVHASFMHEQALRDYGAHYVVIGEGEATLRELCDALDNDGAPAAIKGIAYLEGDKLVKTPPRRPLENLDELPMPDYSFAGDLMRSSGMGFVITSRGCPVQCSFCSTGSYWGQKVRSNSPRRVVDEMEALVATYGVKKIFFHDDTFNLGATRVRDICTEITSRGLNIQWGVSCRVNPVSREMIDTMVAAGCRHICWGIESGSQEMLQRIGKKITREQIKNAFELCRKHLGTITVGAFTMVGNPGENAGTIAESVQFINSLKMTDPPSTAILYILPGTKLYGELLAGHPQLERYWSESDKVPLYTAENSLEQLNQWASMISQGGSIVEVPRHEHFWNNVLFGNIPQAKLPAISFIHSELNQVIPPEIKNDEFYFLIQKLAREENIRTVLEIGSSAGGGSTEAFVTGLDGNGNHPRLYCMEVSKPRFTALRERYADKGFVSCYNVSSVPLSKFPSETEVSKFYAATTTALNSYPLERVISWLRQDIDYLQSSGVPTDGIERIKRENNIELFDMVLIDGSEFTGKAELDEVYGAKFILLDDINGFKNHRNRRRLLADPTYVLLQENWNVRNGYSVFKKKEDSLPIHFFTIVLNGEPFIRHHLEQFLKLPFRWQWHIIEGVAELKHDTAWSLPNGGKISDALHDNGLSNDGTTGYLDLIAREHPGRITLHRKPTGQFWDGKREMVNAPLTAINEECLLWQVDADELWLAGQIEAMREMFIVSPHRTAAYFHCDYFVGPRKYVSSLDTWATYPKDWLRLWRFSPGMKWSAHEPPIILDPKRQNPALLSPFSRDETLRQGITFQHFAYATEAQVRFKEIYYGYKDAVSHWNRLQQTVGPVNPGDFLPWARNDATVEEWPATKGPLLMESLPAQQPVPKIYSSMSVDAETRFETELRKLFRELRPSTIIETGTYLGQGTTSIIWRALRDLGISADFTTMEVNPEHHRQATAHFRAQGMKIRAELGVSVPRELLPDKAEITDKFVTHREYEGIYYDHHEAVRAELYFSETDFKVADDLLYTAMQRCAFKPEFVLLDSAGHMGFIEFQYLMSLIQGDCTLMLDDVYHCKHYKTLQLIKQDPRFRILVESREKFGFCIARYTHVSSLLLVRTDLMGDNVLASALLPPLREKYPDATITLVCREEVAELYTASPLLHRIIGFNNERVHGDETYRESLLKEIRALHADLCLNTLFSRTPLSDLFALEGGARITVAQAGDLRDISPEERRRNNGYYSRLLPNSGTVKSEFQRHHDFLAGIGIGCDDLELPFWALPEDQENVEQLFRESGLVPEKTIIFFAGPREGTKRYDGYGTALAGICREQGLSVIALGTHRERAVTQLILDATGVQTLNLCGATTIRQSGVIISICRLAVGTDTEFAHVACAVGTQSVILLGGEEWGRFLPYSPLTSIVSLPLDCYGCNGNCRYQRAHCIAGIAPETMARAIRETLAELSDRPRLFAQGSEGWQPRENEPLWVPAESILRESDATVQGCAIINV